LEIEIYSTQDKKGNPDIGIVVRGSSHNTPKQIAKAFNDVFEELWKREEVKEVKK